MNSVKPYIRFYTPECTQQIPNLPQRFDRSAPYNKCVCARYFYPGSTRLKPQHNKNYYDGGHDFEINRSDGEKKKKSDK